MDIHGYVWISHLGYTMDISIDISTSFNLYCHITNFEYKLIPLAIGYKSAEGPEVTLENCTGMGNWGSR